MYNVVSLSRILGCFNELLHVHIGIVLILLLYACKGLEKGGILG